MIRSFLTPRVPLRPASAPRAVRSIFTSTRDPADQAEVKRVIELAERSVTTWDLSFTNFYTPPLVSDILANIRPLAGIEAVPWGGYVQAERTRVCIGKDDLLLAAKQDVTSVGGVAVVHVKGKFVFDAANHKDFLGACLGTGIERSKVGDILVLGEDGAFIFMVPELVQHIESTLTQVRTVSVQTREVDLAQISIPQPKVDQIRTVEASLRLDSIASAGFRISRGKMSDAVKSGDVRVNWKSAKPSVSLQTGDIISCTGKGRVEVGEIHVTKKGRYAVDLVRYL